MVQDPLRQAVVGAQVETSWNCFVTVIGCTELLVAAGQGLMIVRGSATATPANAAVAAAAETEKRILNE